MKWNKIDSAPRDGSPILGFDPDHNESKIYVLVWGDRNEEGGWKEASGDNWYTWNPTHWMPLPIPPKE